MEIIKIINTICLALFSLSYLLILICFIHSLYDIVSSTTHSPPSSAVLASNTLRTHGYSIFATSLRSLPCNFSGTVLAPPDFSLSRRRLPVTALLHYHTLKRPLTSSALSSLNYGEQLPTLYRSNCLFLSRSSDGSGEEIAISSTPYRNSISTVKIRQPDLYVDDKLTVHGIDRVLDTNFATKCDFSVIKSTVAVVSPKINRTCLDHAMRALGRRGFAVVAANMNARSSDLLSLNSVTIFAVSDTEFVRESDSFQYDFRNHVLPIRLGFSDLGGLRNSTEFESLAGNKIVASSVDGTVKVNGVVVCGKEVYQNRWIVVISVTMSLDDVVVSTESNRSGLDHPFPGITERQCTVNSVNSVGDEGGELFCVVDKGQEMHDASVEESQPSDGGDRACDKELRPRMLPPLMLLMTMFNSLLLIRQGKMLSSMVTYVLRMQ